jgi:hypothetical protein
MSKFKPFTVYMVELDANNTRPFCELMEGNNDLVRSIGDRKFYLFSRKMC